ncbi:lyase precursor [Amycolatopsis mediterranei S699]|uniref:Lyase n=2 Tax=Amycolatopsis mediterranei TaxID=33910 RepID=A0A0H3CZ22_AMYMU|nr:polysaccharide lyase 6 family protein [Amycolatopsis mediterranei]ADJ43608.1 lyase precursor [Amycolatopsis mediterranei U32]AEK40314.1 lyase precursor [Amycolatopsis mediterranei S699]AFO75320.1 lyase precursor [Amycolatopsis mediterranei S699]AGT82449.1 lyase precursor [Amycolatopsis mediterranei RB]KDO03807.1 lyase [Amycolatopsis mediterranei]
MRLFFVPLIAAALVVVPGPAASAAQVRVTSLAALQSAMDKANPGDTIVLADGSYSAGSTLSIKRSGTSTAPVTVAAEHTGQATITGSKTFAFASGVSNVVLRGFKFRGSAKLSVPAGASNNRLTRNDFQLTADGNWVTVSGDDTVVDRNVFQNRTSQGVFLQILGPSGAMAKRVHVHHNYFYNHQFSGSNGGESIRLGLSDHQSYTANALIENNLFEKADGDSEAISVKSSDNVVRYNTIRDSRGYIVLRHGNRSTVEGNVLFGSGIRFHGNDHKIVNNYVANSGGRAIVFGSGDEADSGPTSKLHDRPDRDTVAYNTVIGSSSVIDGDGGNFKPKDCVVADNIVEGTSGTLVTLPSGSTVKYEGNITSGGTAGIPSRSVDPKLVKDAAGLYRLASGSPAIDAGVGSYPFAAKDFDLQARGGAYDVGADEYFATGATRVPLTKADVGPSAP